jgi:EAL domain-containing protein (putative c-di-GMP-specific phosphodiesterase class I)
MVPAAADRATATGTGGALHARKYVRLQAGGSTRRYEVSVAAAEEGELAVLERVAAWLTRQRERSEQQPAVFTVLLGAAAVEEATFPARAKGIVQRHQIGRGQIGFGLPAAAWREPGAALTRFLGECEAIGCGAVLDDYTLRADAIALLRFPAVRCLKVDAQLTAHAMSDRVAHAELAAIVQAARVLGLHCVAKNVASPAAARWLAALGMDFADRISEERSASATTRTGEALALERAG